jgi:hypothetical protein
MCERAAMVTVQVKANTMKETFRSAMGKLTVVQEDEGWIVLEDARRVGGTLRYPFANREAAQRHVERELAGEAQAMASGNVALSARARVIRETDAELGAKFVEIEEEFACENEDTREAAHRAAGTFIVVCDRAMPRIDRGGGPRICRHEQHSPDNGHSWS